jgi:hypothetical protein
MRVFREIALKASIATPTTGPAGPAGSLGDVTDAPVGSPEHLRFAFAQAVAATDRAIGYWLARHAAPVLADRPDPSPDGSSDDIRALRALVRASATAYVRQLRESCTTPERMVVLVKEAAGHPSAQGFAVQELTSDLVLWSIEAYFDD